METRRRPGGDQVEMQLRHLRKDSPTQRNKTAAAHHDALTSSLIDPPVNSEGEITYFCMVAMATGSFECIRICRAAPSGALCVCVCVSGWAGGRIMAVFSAVVVGSVNKWLSIQ